MSLVRSNLGAFSTFTLRMATFCVFREGGGGDNGKARQHERVLADGNDLCVWWRGEGNGDSSMSKCECRRIGGAFAYGRAQRSSERWRAQLYPLLCERINSRVSWHHNILHYWLLY